MTVLQAYLQSLNLPPTADISAVETAFVQRMKEKLLHVAQNYDEVVVKEEEAWLRRELREYFTYTTIWIKSEKARGQKTQDSPEAAELRKEAVKVLADLQDYIADFASCYMHIGRFVVLLRDEIRAEEQKGLSPYVSDAGGSGGGKGKFSSDIVMMMARYRKEKKALLARIDELENTRITLETTEVHVQSAINALTGLFGKEKADAFMRSLNSGFRTSSKQKISKVLHDVANTKKRFTLDQATAKKHLEDFESAVQSLSNVFFSDDASLRDKDGRVFLRPMEAEMAYNANIKDLQKIRGFLAKYHLPYMQHKLDTLFHLKDKLLVINSLESLMTLYKRLIAGIAHPMNDMKTIRIYEADILNHIKYLLQSHFQELPIIRQRAEETVAEFRETQEDVDNMISLELHEKAISS